MGFKILLVDDDKEFREECRSSLEGFDIIEAADGVEALDRFKKNLNIDLVVLDIKMPQKDGLDVLHEIRRLDHGIGIIMITAYSSKESAVEALKARADDYIDKPIDMERLIASINRVIQQKQSGIISKGRGIKSKIAKVKDFARRNYYKKISLMDVAAAVCLSPKYLSRVFKEQTGKGFNEFKLEIKVEKAKVLLRETENTIEQISEDLAYENPESFIRVFKKFARSTPSEFRFNTMRKSSSRTQKHSRKLSKTRH